MKIQEETKRKFIADNGAVFDNEEECFKYEMSLVQSTIPTSPKYVLGYIREDGTGQFRRFKKHVWKNGNIKWYNEGWTSNVKYAYKFDTFEEAYGGGRTDILTLEEAKKSSELTRIANEKKKDREQRYVKVLCEDRNPAQNGTYITNLGELEYILPQTGWANYETPKFWMQKVNLTNRNI